MNVVKVLFCPLLPHIRNSIILLEGSQALPACPSDKVDTNVKMSVERVSNFTVREQERQCTYVVTMRRVRETIVAVEKQ